MEGRVWRSITELIETLAIPPRLDQRATYSTRLILKMAMLAHLKDRPQNFACRAENWPAGECPQTLPHPGTFSRRLNTPAIRRLLQELVNSAARLVADRRSQVDADQAEPIAAVDGKPLLVRRGSTDRDARLGRSSSGLGVGYRLHAVCDESRRVIAYSVRPLNDHEVPQVDSLFEKAATWLPAGCRIVGDKGYDSLRPYAQCERHGLTFFAPARRGQLSTRMRGRAGERARLSASLEPVATRHRWLRERKKIERVFADLGSTGYGLKGLPNWVRGLSRVWRLVTAKLVIYHCHLAITTQ